MISYGEIAPRSSVRAASSVSCRIGRAGHEEVNCQLQPPTTGSERARSRFSAEAHLLDGLKALRRLLPRLEALLLLELLLFKLLLLLLESLLLELLLLLLELLLVVVRSCTLQI